MSKKKHRIEEHHRLPLSQGGKDTADNISFVQVNKHVAWHTLFPGDTPLNRIVAELNDKWIPPNKLLILTDRPVKNPSQLSLPYHQPAP